MEDSECHNGWGWGGGGGCMIVIAFLLRCSIIGVRDRLHVSRTDGEDKLKL